MKTISSFACLLGLSVVAIACSKADPSSSATSNAATVASGATPATPAAVTPAAPAKPAFVQKGIKPGKVAVGYMVDLSDDAQCAVIADAPEKKEKFTKDADKLAAMMKGKIVAACPTENVVGTCDIGMGMIVNYSGPKYTTESAKKNCTSKPHQTWVD
jgi:hypothetical protein